MFYSVGAMLTVEQPQLYCNIATTDTFYKTRERFVSYHTSLLVLDLVLVARDFLVPAQVAIEFNFWLEWIMNDRL